MLRRDVEVNPGTKRKAKTGRLFLNSISTYNYCKLFFLNSCNSLHKFDIICLSETYFDSNTPLDEDNLEISSYMLVHSDCASNTKHGGVCLYYKNNLLQRVISIGYLNECLTLELKIGDKICNFVVLYTSSSQMSFKILVQKNLFLMTTMGGCDGKSKNCYSQDKTCFEGKVNEGMTSKFGLYQLINEPTDSFENSSSCKDLIFT